MALTRHDVYWVGNTTRTLGLHREMDAVTARKFFDQYAQELGNSDVWGLECEELRAVSRTKRLAHAADEIRETMAYQAGVSSDELILLLKSFALCTLSR